MKENVDSHAFGITMLVIVGCIVLGIAISYAIGTGGLG